MKNFMNQDEYRLFIDESGTANPKDITSQLYILSGCSINNSERQNIKIRADQIKFKYWGHTNIIFHSREIGRKDGDFIIFKNRKKLYEEFLNDLQKFLLNSKFKLFFVIIDKDEARKLNWNNIKIYKETSYYIVKIFLLVLLCSKSRGKIIIESATAEKDFYFHRAVGYFLAEGIKELGVNHGSVKNILTSISFVTKNNHDIEEQIADLFAYGAKCKYFSKKNKKIKSGLYEKMVLNLLKKKIFKIPLGANLRKARFFKKVDNFLILPK